MNPRFLLAALLVPTLTWGTWGCGDDDGPSPDAGTDSDTDSDTDTDTDSDTDTDTDTDSDTDTDTDTDTDSDTDTDTDSDADAGTDAGIDTDIDTDLTWVAVPGGSFQMGSSEGSPDELPVHAVTVPAFEMTRTEVTVAQYEVCVTASLCSEPGTPTFGFGNWGDPGYENHPVNWVDWNQGAAFCEWAGGRLPSEAEWEYAARSGGQDIEFPWGDETATCDYAVMNDGVFGCGTDRTWAVCSKPAGDTDQDLCDMAGNVWEWVQDWHHGTYDGAPADGSAWEIPAGSSRIFRGGSFMDDDYSQRAAYRASYYPSGQFPFLGFRCARSE